MGWLRGINCETKAGKIYRKRMLGLMFVYLGTVIPAVRMVRHGHPSGWQTYLWAILSAIPLLLCLVFMGVYLRDETDEYVRMQTTRSLLVATGALLATVVISDFLRSFTPVGQLPPFTGFVLFFLSFAVAQGVQRMMNRGARDE
jgi:hypothetical protein